MQEQIMQWCGYNWRASMEEGRRIHPDYPWYWYSMDCTNIDEDNILHIFCRKNPKEFKYWDGKIYKPTIEVGTLRTIEAFDYGYFSAEILMPQGKNLSASFWLSGDGNWPPEIDIEEGWTENKSTYYRIWENNFPWFNPGWCTTNTVHYRKKDLTKTSINSHNISLCKQPKNPEKNFIKYECEWLPDNIKFYINGKKIRSVKKSICQNITQNIMDPEKGYKMNVILNVWTENPDIYEVCQTSDMLVRNFIYEQR